MLWVLVRAVSVQGGADTEEKFEGITEIVAVIPIESVGAIIYGELRAEADVEATAVR